MVSLGAPSPHEQLSANTENVYCNTFTIAAVTRNGSIATWGCPQSGGDSTAVQEQLSADVGNV